MDKKVIPNSTIAIPYSNRIKIDEEFYKVRTYNIRTIGPIGSILGMISVLYKGKIVFKSGFAVRADKCLKNFIKRVMENVPPHIIPILDSRRISICLEEIYNHYKQSAIKIEEMCKNL